MPEQLRGADGRPLHLQPRLLGLVVLGGALGTSARHQLAAATAPDPSGWPLVTFAVNVVGSFLLGLLLEALLRRGADVGRRRAVRLGLGTGVLGGFTTYSTFILEADRLLTAGRLWTAGAYAAGSIVAGVLAALAGVALARALLPSSCGRSEPGVAA